MSTAIEIYADSVPTGWESNATGTSVAASEAGTVAAVAREEPELKGAMFLARSFPRDESACYAKLMKSCARPGFADGAEYRFPRGGQDITGPSVNLAREAARCWGNIRYGIRMVAIDEATVHIKGYAFDLETNAYAEYEDRFARLVQRKKRGGGGTEWVKPDERDLRELVNRRGAILVRNAILNVLPPDVIEDALRAAAATLKKAAAGSLESNREDSVRKLVVAFDGLGVTVQMLGTYLGHDVGLVNPDEFADLRKIFTSLRDGHSRREEYFDFAGAAPARGAAAADVVDRLRKAPAPAPAAAAQPAPVQVPELDEVGLTGEASAPADEPTPADVPVRETPPTPEEQFIAAVFADPAGGGAKAIHRQKILAASAYLDEEGQERARLFARHDALGKAQAAEAAALAGAVIEANTTASADGGDDELNF